MMTIPQVDKFSITGYINASRPPQLAGSIVGLLYFYGGLSSWLQLPGVPPLVPSGTVFHLAPQWHNQSSEAICGHVELAITEPGGGQVALSDVLNQDRWASPSDGWAVQFAPITLDRVGTYRAIVTLSSMSQVLDQQAFDVAVVTPNYGASIDFYRRLVCISETTYPDGTRVCVEWDPNERIGEVTIINTGDAAVLITRLKGWLYLGGSPHQQFANCSWSDYLGASASTKYQIAYSVPTTGMAIDVRFFIAVYVDNNLIAEAVFIVGR